MRHNWRIPKRKWDKAVAEVLERSNGVCENCGLPIDHTRTKIGRTDLPRWTIHHIIPVRNLKEKAHELCKVLEGKAYRKCIRMVFVKLATDVDNLELRCHRVKCRIH